MLSAGGRLHLSQASCKVSLHSCIRACALEKEGEGERGSPGGEETLAGRCDGRVCESEAQEGIRADGGWKVSPCFSPSLRRSGRLDLRVSVGRAVPGSPGGTRRTQRRGWLRNSRAAGPGAAGVGFRALGGGAGVHTRAPGAVRAALGPRSFARSCCRQGRG